MTFHQRKTCYLIRGKIRQRARNHFSKFDRKFEEFCIRWRAIKIIAFTMDSFNLLSIVNGNVGKLSQVLDLVASLNLSPIQR
jgi:hypothetical protein